MKPTDRGVEEELNRFLLKGQRRTAHAMAFVCGFIAFAQLIFIFTTSRAQSPVLLILPAIFVGIAFAEWLYARQIGRHLREGKGPLRWTSLVTAIGEASLPSTGVVLFHVVLGWEEALRSPPIFGYFIMLVLSVLRLDTRVSITMGLVQAVTLTAILFYAAVAQGAVSSLQIRFSISNIALILVATGIVAVIIRFTRSLVFDLIATQRNKAAIEEKLASTAEAHQRAEQMIWHKDRLFAILGHDLRSPLNGVAGLSELMARTPEQFTAEEIRRYAGEIHQTSRHLRELVENLLAWAQLRTGQMKQTQDDCVSAELVAQTLALHEAPAHAKQVRMKANGSSVRFVSDARCIQTILRNLVSNAVKFTPSGGVVSVATTMDSENVTIVVRNSGSAFPDVLARQLELGLAVASSPGTAQEEGLGIGLLLCHELALSLKGSLRLENKMGEAAALLSLPLLRGGETHAEWQMPPDRSHRESPISS